MAQFAVVPIISRIKALFEAATHVKFVKEACWTTWQPVKVSDYEWLYDFIRPSHQKLLIETVEGIQKNPCSLLRQLLRPHDYRIDRTANGWILKEGRKSTSSQSITVRKGIMTWDEDYS